MKHYIKTAPLMFALLMCVMAGFSHAQSLTRNERLLPVTDQQANEFYKECLQQKYPENDTGTSKDMFCACSSARLSEQLTRGDVEDLKFNESREAIAAKQKLLEYVYTPCISTSVETLIAEECEQSVYLDEYSFINKKKFCACQNRRMGMVFTGSLGTITQSNKENLDKALADPISAFMTNEYYVKKSKKITEICMDVAKIKVEKKEPLTKYPGSLLARPSGQ